VPDRPAAASRHCAFLTLEERGDWVIDDETAIPALEHAGWTVSTVPWSRPAVDWRGFDIVVVRSTWDYWDAPAHFFTVLESINAQTRLANPLALMRWNLSKTYLHDLAQAGVAIVPTLFIGSLTAADLASAHEAFAADGWVLKPQVGASGIDAFLFRSANGQEQQALARLAGQAVLIQPFRRSVIEEGEYSLFFFDGVYSHAICKRPAPGEFRSQEERGAVITPLEPAGDLRRAGALALAALEQHPLYARVDLVRNQQGDPELMELELIEPSLYFRTSPGAPAAFARALDNWMARGAKLPVQHLG
jgi:glutathione synthase/RimK-type ligase-like ATP-grasp enzyme